MICASIPVCFSVKRFIEHNHDWLDRALLVNRGDYRAINKSGCRWFLHLLESFRYTVRRFSDVWAVVEAPLLGCRGASPFVS